MDIDMDLNPVDLESKIQTSYEERLRDICANSDVGSSAWQVECLQYIKSRVGYRYDDIYIKTIPVHADDSKAVYKSELHSKEKIPVTKLSFSFFLIPRQVRATETIDKTIVSTTWMDNKALIIHDGDFPLYNACTEIECMTEGLVRISN